MGDLGAMISSNGTDDVRASLTACPNCNPNLARFPAGVRFNPSDEQLIEHLETLVLVKEGGGGGGSRAHALINHFIPTIEGDKDICYTHPENLPGVTRDGLSKHFFHRTSKAYPTSTRKRRKILSECGQSSTEDVGETHYCWRKTGKTRPVIVGGRQKGCKKILVLHSVKQGKRENTNWVMHQYNLGMSKDEKVGDLVVSKVFYHCAAATMMEQNDDDKIEVTSEATPNNLPISAVAVTAATVSKVELQQHQLQSQAHGHGQCIFGPGKMSQEAGVGDRVSGDQGQLHGNNHHIPSQRHVQSVNMEPDTTLSLAIGTGWCRS